MHELILRNLELMGKDYPDIVYIKLLKTGKEASVHLVEADGELMALKIYKQHQKYASRGQYVQLHELGAGQTQRAVKNRSRAGRRLMANIWVNREYTLLRKLANAGADVPEVYMLGDNGFLMEYLGDRQAPAPRLIDVQLTQQQAEHSFQIIKNNIWALLQLGYVHGDLSGYNILWWQEHPYIIDFPQVLNVFHNSNARDKLLHDIEQINEYFGTHGLGVDEQEMMEMTSLIVI